jgi:hypothetical protein
VGGAGKQRLDTRVSSESAGGRSRWIGQSCGCCGRKANGAGTRLVSHQHASPANRANVFQDRNGGGCLGCRIETAVTEKVPRIRYQLWNGKRKAALEPIEAVYFIGLPSDWRVRDLLTMQRGYVASGNT